MIAGHVLNAGSDQQRQSAYKKASLFVPRPIP
jgi:hypothetical protein